MRLYDLVLVLRPELTEAKRKQLLEAIKGFLKGVTIAKEADLGQKVLAYPIKKEQAGYYVQFALESETGLPKDFEQKLFQNDAVLRHLVIRNK